MELFTWLESALLAFQGRGLNLVVDYERLGLADIEDFGTDQISDLVEDYRQDRAVMVTIVSNVSSWQLQVFEQELEESLPHLVSSQLDVYPTNEILIEALREMWFEMGDYMVREQANALQAFLASQQTPCWQIEVSLNGFDLVNPLPLPWDQAAVDPEIDR